MDLRKMSHAYRKAHNLKQSHLAAIAGVHQSMISRIENGTEISEETEKKFAEIFAHPPDLTRAFEADQKASCTFVMELNPGLDIADVVSSFKGKKVITLAEFMKQVSIYALGK